MKKTVAISGGLGKIGLSIALNLSKKKFNVIIGDINDKKYQKIKRKLDLANIKFFRGNLCLEKDINKFISFGAKHFKKIDYTIHCCYPKPKRWNAKIDKLDQDDLNKNISNHLGGSIIYSLKFIKHFLKNGGGKIIHFSSIQGISAPKFDHYVNLNMNSPIAYSAIKSGIISITRYLAKYYGSKNIDVNCISPGGIMDKQDKVFINRYKKSCLTKGLLDFKDIQPLVIFLLSDGSKFMNGQNFIIDDGWSL